VVGPEPSALMFQSISPYWPRLLLFVLPKIVEQSLVVHVHGYEHAVADPSDTVELASRSQVRWGA